VKHTTEARSYIKFCSGKAIIITDSECVFVALGIQYAMCMRHIVVCGMYGPTVYFHVISSKTDFRKKNNVTEPKMCVLISSKIFVWNVSHSKKNWVR